MNRSKPLARKTPIRNKSPMRKSRPKSTPARRAAKGMPCMIRLPGCDGGGETTVLAHYRLNSGIGIKPDDHQAAWSCVNCHDIADGRKPIPEGHSLTDVRLAHAHGVFRTQEAIRRNAT